jgi:hypothetical protein
MIGLLLVAAASAAVHLKRRMWSAVAGTARERTSPDR